MFTGIIETTGIVEKKEIQGSNIHFTLSCPFTDELKIDQSVAHDGCCLTVVNISGRRYTVTAIAETLKKTNLSEWNTGTAVNLERCTKVGSRLDGHIVQGHVDKTGEIIAIRNKEGSYLITIDYSPEGDFVTVPQGSVTVNGISLTVAESEKNRFTIAIIPYTWENTNLKNLKEGDRVNIEFDIIGKYIAKLVAKNASE